MLVLSLLSFLLLNLLIVSLSELVLKVRVQNLRDNDFIEIELDRQELTYQDLLRVSCCELGVNPEEVEKIRKLPNTLLRNVRIETRDWLFTLPTSENIFLQKDFQISLLLNKIDRFKGMLDLS